MRAHCTVAAVAEEGCKALSNISFLDAGEQAAIDAGATAFIVAALRAHPGNAAVAEEGCRALTSVTYLYAGKQAAIAAGAPASITD